MSKRNKCINSDFIKINDFFKDYPYPCRDLLSNTIPNNPYIPKDKLVCDHKYSLDKDQWRTIIIKYLDNLKEEILTGNPFKMPNRMGDLQAYKYKGGGIDWVKSKKLGKRIKYNNFFTGGFKPLIKWNRIPAKLYNKWYWVIKLVPGFSNKIGSMLLKNPSIINNYNET